MRCRPASMTLASLPLLRLSFGIFAPRAAHMRNTRVSLPEIPIAFIAHMPREARGRGEGVVSGEDGEGREPVVISV